MAKKAITFRLKPETIEKVKVGAAAHQTSQAKFVEIAVDAAPKPKKSR